jgi:hypothetical protein
MEKRTGLPEGTPNDDEMLVRELMARMAHLSVDERRAVCRRLLAEFPVELADLELSPRARAFIECPGEASA